MKKAHEYYLLETALEKADAEYKEKTAAMRARFLELKNEIMGLLNNTPGEIAIEGGIAKVTKSRSGHPNISAENIRLLLTDPDAGPIVAPLVTNTKDALKLKITVIN